MPKPAFMTHAALLAEISQGRKFAYIRSVIEDKSFFDVQMALETADPTSLAQADAIVHMGLAMVVPGGNNNRLSNDFALIRWLD